MKKDHHNCEALNLFATAEDSTMPAPGVAACGTSPGPTVFVTIVYDTLEKEWKIRSLELGENPNGIVPPPLNLHVTPD